MTIEERTAEARRQLAAAEDQMLRAFATAKSLVAAQEEALRTAQLEQLKRDDEFLTGAELAEIFRVSPKTIRELVKSGQLEPIWIASLPRFSKSEHVEKAAEIFREKPPRRRRTKKQMAEAASQPAASSKFQMTDSAIQTKAA